MQRTVLLFCLQQTCISIARFFSKIKGFLKKHFFLYHTFSCAALRPLTIVRKFGIITVYIILVVRKYVCAQTFFAACMKGDILKEFFPTLYGNHALRQQIGEKILQGRFSHAFLIQGAEGTGKQTLARAIAAALSCQALHDENQPLPCGCCPACRRILAANTPDLILVGNDGAATIGIEAVRRIKEDMFLSPTEFDRKVYIIEDADTMTPAAQNALLIMLESPPDNVTILLLCRNASAMLPTVRSRVQILRTELFTPSALSDFVLSRTPSARTMQSEDPDRFYDLIAAAGGSPGIALDLFTTEDGAAVLAARKTVLSLLQALHPKVGVPVLYEAVTALPQKRAELLSALQLFLLAVRDLILLKKDEQVPLCFFGRREAALALCDTFGMRNLLSVGAAILETATQVEQNANLALVFTSLSDALFSARIK